MRLGVFKFVAFGRPASLGGVHMLGARMAGIVSLCAKLSTEVFPEPEKPTFVNGV